ncbi:MAG: hypothetical protein HYZ81_13830 [Nitrospinae bacterium]|nr:hypothetical protein [Nitrospinota bacterium]
MRLELEISEITELTFGAATGFADGHLQLNPSDLKEQLADDRRLGMLEVDVVQPGERARVCRVFDAFEPRAKIGEGENFPGVLGRLALAGGGRTRALKGAAVVVTDQLTTGVGAVIDMLGPAAAYTPFAHMHNLVVSAQPAAGVSQQLYQSAIRLAGLKTAVCLAQLSCQKAPNTVEVYELPPVSQIPPASQHLPRVAYIFQIHSHQRPTGLEEGILYGDNVRRLVPTVLHPNEILDGAVIRGFSNRNATTYALQNHPVIRDLYRRHGKDIWFAGVVVTVAQATEPERVRSALVTASLVKHVLGADGAIFTKMGGGAPHVDMAQAAEQCERLGVKTVVLAEEMSTDGTSEGALLFNFPHMDAVVNLGNSQAPLHLPAVARVIGIPWDTQARQLAAGALEARVGMICGAVEQVGASQLTATAI